MLLNSHFKLYRQKLVKIPKIEKSFIFWNSDSIMTKFQFIYMHNIDLSSGHEMGVFTFVMTQFNGPIDTTQEHLIGHHLYPIAIYLVINHMLK